MTGSARPLPVLHDSGGIEAISLPHAKSFGKENSGAPNPPLGVWNGENPRTRRAVQPLASADLGRELAPGRGGLEDVPAFPSRLKRNWLDTGIRAMQTNGDWPYSVAALSDAAGRIGKGKAMDIRVRLAVAGLVGLLLGAIACGDPETVERRQANSGLENVAQLAQRIEASIELLEQRQEALRKQQESVTQQLEALRQQQEAARQQHETALKQQATAVQQQEAARLQQEAANKELETLKETLAALSEKTGLLAETFRGLEAAAAESKSAAQTLRDDLASVREQAATAPTSGTQEEKGRPRRPFSWPVRVLLAIALVVLVAAIVARLTRPRNKSERPVTPGPFPKGRKTATPGPMEGGTVEQSDEKPPDAQGAGVNASEAESKTSAPPREEQTELGAIRFFGAAKVLRESEIADKAPKSKSADSGASGGPSS